MQSPLAPQTWLNPVQSTQVLLLRPHRLSAVPRLQCPLRSMHPVHTMTIPLLLALLPATPLLLLPPVPLLLPTPLLLPEDELVDEPELELPPPPELPPASSVIEPPPPESPPHA